MGNDTGQRTSVFFEWLDESHGSTENHFTVKEKILISPKLIIEELLLIIQD